MRERSEQLDHLSRIDALTGCYNRRHIDEQMHHHGSSATRSALAMAVLMFDIDHFKKVNDTEGHHAGDVILQQFVRRLQMCVRAGDVVGRWGGEEFVVIAPHTDLTGALLLGERARAAVSDEPFDLGDHQLSITVSVGCAAGPCAAEMLMKLADGALYESKGNGRNRVTAAEPVI